MKEQAFRADAREAKGLHEGSMSRIVRAVESKAQGVSCEVSWNATLGAWVVWKRRTTRHGWFRCPNLECPFGVPGDRLRAVCEPGEPCEHHGCLSHVTHVCERCGRGHAGILLDLTDVRVIRVQEITEEDAKACGIHVLPLQDADDPSSWWESAPGQHQARNPLASLRLFWDSLHADDGHGWRANDYVWLGTVKRAE